jgi:putative hemolysin
MNRLCLVLSVTLSACASTTGVVSTGKNTYMIAREDNGPTASIGAIKASTFKEAGAFCAGQGKSLQVVKESDTPRSLGQFPQTTLHFACE